VRLSLSFTSEGSFSSPTSPETGQTMLSACLRAPAVRLAELAGFTAKSCISSVVSLSWLRALPKVSRRDLAKGRVPKTIWISCSAGG